MLSSQGEFGVTKMTPSDSDLPDGVRESFQECQPWGTDRNLQQVYIKSFQLPHVVIWGCAITLGFFFGVLPDFC